MSPDQLQPERRPTDTPVRVLHVSRDPAFAERVTETLEGETAVHVVTVATASTALDRIRSDRIDCVLSDHDLPADTGLELFEEVRESHPELPFVLCAADGSERLASDAVSAGVTDYLPRPSDAEGYARLVETIELAVATRKKDTTTDDEPLAAHAGAVLASSDVATFVTDSEGTVVWLNDAAADYFGLETGDVVGEPRRQVVRDRLAPAAADASRFADHVLDTRNGADERQFLCHVREEPNRDARWLDYRSHPVREGEYAGGRVDQYADVTEYVRSEYGLRDLMRIIVDEESFADRLNSALTLGTRLLDLPFGYVTGIDDDEQRIVDAVGGHDRLQPGESCPLMQSYCRRTLAADGLVSIPDAIAAGWENDPAYEVFELESYIGAPVVVRGDDYGTLCFASKEPRERAFDDDEELFVEYAATWAGYELERLGRADA